MFFYVLSFQSGEWKERVLPSPLPAHSIIRRASFMRLPGPESHVRMNCEQDFGDGGMNVTLTLRLLMHGKVTAHTYTANSSCFHCKMTLRVAADV